MKVKLNLKNRILAFSLIANTKEASLTDWRVINDAKQKLGISEKDRELYKIEEVEGDKSKGIQWKNRRRSFTRKG